MRVHGSSAFSCFHSVSAHVGNAGNGPLPPLQDPDPVWRPEVFSPSHHIRLRFVGRYIGRRQKARQEDSWGSGACRHVVGIFLPLGGWCVCKCAGMGVHVCKQNRRQCYRSLPAYFPSSSTTTTTTTPHPPPPSSRPPIIKLFPRYRNSQKEQDYSQHAVCVQKVCSCHERELTTTIMQKGRQAA